MSIVVALVLVVGVGAVMMAVAVQAWRRPDMDPLDVPFARMLPLGPAGRAAISRAMLSWACAELSIAAVVVLITARQWSAAGLVIIFGLMGFSVSVLTVAWFNRPKFLVPPHRRAEIGLVNGWLRRRGVSRRRGGGR